MAVGPAPNRDAVPAVQADAVAGVRGRDAATAVIDRVARVDLVGAVVAAVAVALINVVSVRSGLLWIVPAALVGLAGALALAIRAARRGHLLPAVAWITSGHWLAALIVPVALPFLWPVMAIVVIVPLVLVAPHADRRLLTTMIVGAGAVVAAVALIGLRRDDTGALPDVGDTAELVVVIVALAALMVPIAVIAWWNNLAQQRALDDALRLNAELNPSRRRVVEASDSARRAIERDLHDGAQQRLVALSMAARQLSATSPGEQPDRAAELADDLVAGLDQAIAEVRELAHGISPPVLATWGLGAALGAAARRVEGADLVGGGPATTRFEREVEAALYFTALEALANAAKHAPGAEVRVRLVSATEEVTLDVVDDGPGFAVDDPVAGDVRASHGVANMRERIAAVGGELTIESRPGDGTSVRAVVPIGASQQASPV